MTKTEAISQAAAILYNGHLQFSIEVAERLYRHVKERNPRSAEIITVAAAQFLDYSKAEPYREERERAAVENALRLYEVVAARVVYEEAEAMHRATGSRPEMSL